MSQNRPILNCNNNINCNICASTGINAAANAAIKHQIVVAAEDDITDISLYDLE